MLRPVRFSLSILLLYFGGSVASGKDCKVTGKPEGEFMVEGMMNIDGKIAEERPAISPALARILPGEEVRFTVNYAGKTLSDIAWSVNDIPGGNEAFGTISNGIYEAPQDIPVPNEIHIGAKINGSKNRQLWSTVIVGRHDPTYKLLKRWEREGDGPGELTEPHGICIDRDGSLIITDATLYRVYRFSTDGDFLGEIGLGRGTGPGFFQGPRDAKVDADGNIYITDGTNSRIQKFDNSGRLMGVWGKKGSGKGDLIRPHAIDLDKFGRLYVVDVDNSRVTAYDLDGNYLLEWGSQGGDLGQFSAAHGLGVDPNGDVFVAEYNGRCQKFTGEGELLFAFAESDRKCHAMCTDRWGDVYLMARNEYGERSHIRKYNSNGIFITSWEINGKNGRKFGPLCAAVDSLGYVYVTDGVGIDIFAPTIEQRSGEYDM